ncbi:MAG: capsule assembly Wzi family protein [Aquisalimonadaceae bacterium]
MRAPSTTILLLCLLAWAPGNAAYLPQGDPVLRHDLQLLVDEGVLSIPLGTWPLPANAVSELREVRLEGRPQSVHHAYRRVLRQFNSLQGGDLAAEAAVSVAPEPVQLRTFADTPRETAELTVATADNTPGAGYRLAVTLALDPEDDRAFRLDGSYVAIRLGNWILSAGAQDRWWGPGWDGSLILGNNARPVPVLAIERDNPAAVDVPVLRWLGPVQFTTFLGQLESERAVPRAKLFGMRLSFRPSRSVEIGLSRTAQWGGEGRPEDLQSFGRMLVGRSNLGDTDSNMSGGDANQLAGYDLRWTSPFGSAPYAVYGQLIGEDEAGHFPYRYIGLAGVETWGSWGRTDYRLHLEAADTAAEFHNSPPNYNVAYEHSGYRDGYRYRERSLGHAMDGDGLMLSVGLQLITPAGDHWRILVRHTEQNRDGHERRPGISPEKATFTGADVVYTFDWHGNYVTLGAGADRAKDRADDADLDTRGWFSITRQF